MLRSFLRLFSEPMAPEALDVVSSKGIHHARINVRIDARGPTDPPQPTRPTQGTRVSSPVPGMTVATDAPKTVLSRLPSRTNHRQRLLSMKLVHTRICSARRAQRLAEMGIMTAGDMAYADPAILARKFTASQKAARVLVQYRRAIRLAATVPGMTPRDAMLLVSIHRRSAVGLACETPAVLYRDMQRFAESSQGQSLLRGRRIPSMKRIKQWVLQCDSVRCKKPMQAQAA